MTNQLSDEEIYKLAKERVEAKKGFFVHLAVYIIVNIVLVTIWATAAGRGNPWFLWPLGGWGIGILFHGLSVFFFSKSDKSAIDKEYEKLKKELRD